MTMTTTTTALLRRVLQDSPDQIAVHSDTLQDVAGGDDEEKATAQFVMEILGTIGGACIALSLAPQVWKAYSTRSAHDISYVYQGICIVGLTLVNLYSSIHQGLWLVFLPALVELSLIVVLLVLKIRCDKGVIRDAVVKAMNVSQHSTASKTGVSKGADDDMSEGFGATRSRIEKDLKHEETSVTMVTDKDGC
jgi:uncharacterized protein with PQ loop repeat